MASPTQKDFDIIRRQGFRPQVVGCILHDKKILFVYDQKYNLWQLPQGGVDNKESLEDAFQREMAEELGSEFVENIKDKLMVVGTDQIIFPASTQDSRQLMTDTGETIFMQGKKYFFAVAASSDSKLDITHSEFDDFCWVSYKEALDLTERIYQKGKQRITRKAVDILKESDLL